MKLKHMFYGALGWLTWKMALRVAQRRLTRSRRRVFRRISA